MNKKIDLELIAPCGMNCAICSAYLAFINNIPIVKCKGCRARNKQCAFLKKRCKDDLKLLTGEIAFCSECNYCPCENLRHLDGRYRNNYRMSMIDNLEYIKKYGLKKFAAQQYKKYHCKNCGGLISVHNNKCFKCDKIESWRK
jgi:hypothetical protein